MRLIVVLILAFNCCQQLSAQQQVFDLSPLWPGTEYREDTPDYVSVVGYPPGHQISSHAQIRQYFDALANAHPERIQLFPYATSWEGRELFYVVIGNRDNISHLAAIRNNIQQLADPRETPASEASDLISMTPGTVWLSYAVHGNEISTSDAAMFTAYHLLAAENDPVVDSILANTLVFIDPLQNPDGRDRFVNGFRQARGLVPDTSRFAVEHDEAWPSGRVNHYLFDLNRDWLALTQPETRGRVAAIRQWYPLAFVDAHEMGSDSTYFFAPEAVPYNPHLAQDQRDNLTLFGRNNAKWFDRYGFEYFTREVFDAFYPGYGASWPSYYGGIAMTYEQASPRGLAVRRANGSLLTYREAVRHHFVSSVATAETVAVNRQKLLEDFYDYRRSAIAEGSRGDLRSFIIPAQADQGGAQHLGRLMAEHGAEVWLSSSEFSACGTDYSAGSMVIPLAQPAKRLLRTMLDRQVDIDPAYITEQQRRLDKGLAHQIYDVTAWSLPLMFNIQIDECGQNVATDSMQQLNTDTVITPSQPGVAQLAYIIPGGDRRTTEALSLLLRAGIKVKSSHQPFTHAGREYPSGSLIVQLADNPDNLRQVMLDLQAELNGMEIVALNDSWVTNGPSFGSFQTASLTAPNVALAWDSPSDVYSPGAVRFVIERQFGYPVTPIRISTLGRTQLDDFDVLILPDSSAFLGGYSAGLSDAALGAVKGWIERGGVLITLADATTWAADKDVGLLSIRREFQVRDEDAGQSVDLSADTLPGRLIEQDSDFQQLLFADEHPPVDNPGALVKAVVDPDHWLSAGVAAELNVLVRGQRIFSPIPQNAGTNVVRFANADDLLQSGHLWPEVLPQLAYKPFVVTQPRRRGMVIGFTEDPTVRAYLNGLNTIFMNAVLRAPSYSGKLR